MQLQLTKEARVGEELGRAAKSYEQHDVLQREVQAALLERLDFYTQAPQRVIDVGAGTGTGTGRGSALLKQRYAKSEVIAADLALPMLRAAKQHSSWLKPFIRVCAEATSLPLADHGVDVLHSNLCFQWIDDLPPLFAECVRVLKPGGLLAFSTFGPDTLKELRAAWAEADHARERGLTGKTRYRRMLAAYEAMRVDGRIPATWEAVTTHAWGPPQGQARRGAGGAEIASFSVDSLRGSRRR